MTSGIPAFEIIGENRDSQIIVTCDHASNYVPVEINGGNLGLPANDMMRHIAYDIGALGVATRLGELLNAPVIASKFSRLVIDPNRGEDDPTLIMQLYDGTLIPGNRRLSQADRDFRLANLYRPYHDALASLVSGRPSPILIAIHSFTSQLASRPKRPWHIGILHENDQRIAIPLLNRLRRETELCVGENEPYGGHLIGDSMDKHALKQGHANTLIEVRNDLIEDEAHQLHWAERLAPFLAELAAPAMV